MIWPREGGEGEEGEEVEASSALCLIHYCVQFLYWGKAYKIRIPLKASRINLSHFFALHISWWRPNTLKSYRKPPIEIMAIIVFDFLINVTHCMYLAFKHTSPRNRDGSASLGRYSRYMTARKSLVTTAACRKMIGRCQALHLHHHRTWKCERSTLSYQYILFKWVYDSRYFPH